MGNNDSNGVKPVDSVVESIVEQFRERSRIGIEKYGTTLDRKDLTLIEWLEMAKQEAMDFTLYIQRLQNEILYVEKKLENYQKENHVQTKRRAWHF